jgi:DNA polymerase-3 subunit delta'
VAGHERTIGLLRAQVESGALSHALLFVGEARIGKTTLARALAEERLLGGESSKSVEWHPDFWIDDRDDPLRVDEIRFQAQEDRVHAQSLQQFLALMPFAGGSRVAVLASADRMTDEAANCLLKTLEEPPPRSTLVLTTARADRLAPTVVSRCQTLALTPLGDVAIEAWLVRSGFPAPRAGEVAALARGRPGWALEAARQEEEWSRYQEWLQQLIDLSTASPLALVEYADRFGEDREPAQREARARAALAVWQLWLRDCAVLAAGSPELALHRSHAEALQRFGARWSAGELARMLQLSLEAQQRIEQHVNPRLAMEVFLLESFAAPGRS